jgi:hypothetical protein
VMAPFVIGETLSPKICVMALPRGRLGVPPMALHAAAHWPAGSFWS